MKAWRRRRRCTLIIMVSATFEESPGVPDGSGAEKKEHEETERRKEDGKEKKEDEDEEVSDADEEILQKCIDVIVQEQKASTSLLQRRLRLGYTRAARMVDILEQRGVVGPADGARPREVYLKGEPVAAE